jgi:serine/threonine-protein kinase
MGEFPKKSDLTELCGYNTTHIVGEGGTGRVYRGIDPKSGETVAIKVLRTNFFRNKMHERELAKNVKKFKKLDHPNLVKVYEYEPGPENNCIILEFVDGPDMKWYIDTRPWALQERLVVMAQICNGLGHLHEKGFIHHDIKPANVLFTRKGQVKLCDFSLAGTGGLMAMFDQGLKEQVTPMYVSPELIRKEKATTLSDMYSLGVLMYVFFTGKIPFEVDTLQRLYHCHLNEMPIHPTISNNKVPEPLGNIIMRLLSKDPDRRFQTCDQLRITLSEIGQSRI